MPVKDVLLALMVTMIWGFNFVMIKIGVGDVPPLMLTGLRFLFAALPLVFFIERPAIGWPTLISYGLVLGVIKFGLLFVAIKIGLSASLSSLVLQLQAFFTIAFAFVVLGERPGRWQIIGAAIAFAGIGVIAAERWVDAELVPLLLCVAAAGFWGVANIISKRAGKLDMLSFMVWASLIPPLPLFALSAIFEGDAALTALNHPTPMAIVSVAYLAYPTTILGFAIWNHLLHKHPASTVAPFSLMVPVFGFISGMLVLGETMSPAVAIGAVAIFAGLLVNVFGRRLFGRRAAVSGV